jgi:hypothetical protein
MRIAIPVPFETIITTLVDRFAMHRTSPRFIMIDMSLHQRFRSRPTHIPDRDQRLIWRKKPDEESNKQTDANQDTRPKKPRLLVKRLNFRRHLHIQVESLTRRFLLHARKSNARRMERFLQDPSISLPQILFGSRLLRPTHCTRCTNIPFFITTRRTSPILSGERHFQKLRIRYLSGVLDVVRHEPRLVGLDISAVRTCFAFVFTGTKPGIHPTASLALPKHLDDFYVAHVFVSSIFKSSTTEIKR